MEKIYDVTALGELLIDFTENGTSAQGNPLLEANPGVTPPFVSGTCLTHTTIFIVILLIKLNLGLVTSYFNRFAEITIL